MLSPPLGRRTEPEALKYPLNKPLILRTIVHITLNPKPRTLYDPYSINGLLFGRRVGEVRRDGAHEATKGFGSQLISHLGKDLGFRFQGLRG